LDHEDLDLGLRLWQRGWSTVTVPEAKVYHAVNASNVHQLAKTGQSVAERRYVSGRASLSIIPLKYFSPIAAVSAAIAIYTAVLAKDVVRGRWRLTFLDILAGLQILQRLPSALQWRSANRRWNKCRAGEALFSAPDFQDAEGEPCSWNAPRR
jgi:GT2 family glycosyltransferase